MVRQILVTPASSPAGPAASRRRPTSVLLFATAYALFAILIFRTHVYTRHADVLAWGVTFDLALTMPMAWWFFVIRLGHAKPISIIPIFVLCTLAASRIVPAAQHTFIDQLRWVAAPLDLVTLYLVARGRWALGDSVAGRVFRMEVETLRYALFSWREKTPEGFTFHQRSGWGSVVVCFLVAVTAESIGVHLFLAHYSARVAWIVTALDVYGMLWLIGDYHALRLRTTIVRDDALEVRFGLRWSVTLDRANIAAVEPIREWKPRKGVLKLALLDEPKLLVRLREPVVATGLAGIRRTITALGVLPDDLDGFARALV